MTSRWSRSTGRRMTKTTRTPMLLAACSSPMWTHNKWTNRKKHEDDQCQSNALYNIHVIYNIWYIYRHTYIYILYYKNSLLDSRPARRVHVASTSQSLDSTWDTLSAHWDVRCVARWIIWPWIKTYGAIFGWLFTSIYHPIYFDVNKRVPRFWPIIILHPWFLCLETRSEPIIWNPFSTWIQYSPWRS